MIANTTNYGLYVTDDNTETFQSWREAMNSTTNSNMTKIDSILAARTKIYTGSCSTAAGTAAKTATLDNSTGFSLTAGVMVVVRFTYGNSATTPTLNVNSTGAKTIAISSSATAYTTGNGTTYNTWGAYESILFTYTGTYWTHIPSGYLGYLAYKLANGKQASITASGLLKGNGSGTITEAIAGTDYQAPLPSQSGNSGKFLTTNGSAMSWGTVDALPSQSGQSGKYLTTNGTSASWGTVASVSASTITTTTTWSGSGPYTQTVTLSGYTATANTKVDIQLTAAQIVQLITDGVTSLLVSNSNGTLTMYATGAKPTTAMTIQATCTEVTAV